MAFYPSKGESLWLSSAPAANYPALEADLHVDVAVIGGGIAGLTTAYLLKQRGREVAVFEKDTIGSRVSGYTTAKVTSQHGVTYSELTHKFGMDDARCYGDANQAAIEQIEEIIRREGIECDWRREDNYVYTENLDDIATLQREAADAQLLGLPASFETETPLPFGVKGAVRFENQATFHIAKYLQGLARAIDGGGCHIYEHTPASRFDDGELCMFETPNGTVTANSVILATNAPSALKDHLAYSVYEYPTRSYIVAGKTDHELSGMYITANSPTRSILPTTIDGEKWLLIGGEGHFVGVSGPADGRYDTLSAYAKERFGIENIAYKWSTWDFVAYDHKPLVGKLYPWSKNTYVITGLRKWGMTNATVAATIIADGIVGQENLWAKTFRSNRGSTIRSLPKGLWGGIRANK